jgi:hypothetical protein
MVADGAEGLRIVHEGINQGSKNYEIMGGLLGRGAVLMKTESLSLVKQEYSYITKMTRSRSLKEREVAAARYKLARDRLLKQRDAFISGRINETLAEGETGILFIGAYHDVIRGLDPDIKVGHIKEVARVRDYHKSLVNPKLSGQCLQSPGEYLISPVSSISF